MKKIFSALLVFFFFSFASCGIVSDEQNSTNENTFDVNVSDVVIDALESNDTEAIKNLFSNHAKQLCEDTLSDGIAYMMNLYEGDFIECTQSNSSFTTKQGGKEKYVQPVCVFQTTSHYYKLSWNACTKNSTNEDRLGVYSMKFEIWEDAGLNQGGQDLPVAGIVTDKNEDICNSSFEVLRIIYQKDYLEDYCEEFKELLSDELLADIGDEKVEDFFEMTTKFKSASIGDGWVNYNSDGFPYVYLLSNKSPQDYICLAMDEKQMDKIAYLKVGKWDTETETQSFDEDANIGIYFGE